MGCEALCPRQAAGDRGRVEGGGRGGGASWLLLFPQSDAAQQWNNNILLFVWLLLPRGCCQSVRLSEKKNIISTQKKTYKMQPALRTRKTAKETK